MRLSLVVPATDEPPTLERCLGAVRASAEPPDEVVVVGQPSYAPVAAVPAGVAASLSRP